MPHRVPCGDLIVQQYIATRRRSHKKPNSLFQQELRYCARAIREFGV